MRRYFVYPDAELFGMLSESAERFWVDHIVKKVPPPVDGSEGYAAWLAEHFPQSKGALLPETPAARGLALQLKSVRSQLEALEEEKAALENAFKLQIGEADGMAGNGWSITWKSTAGREAIDWKKVAEEARVPKEIIAKHSRRTPYRMFKFNAKDLP